MADSVDLLEKEKISKELIVTFNEWKEIIVFFHEVMAWKKNWFPAVIVSSVTSFYLYVWLTDCSVLNLAWTTGLCVALLDCLACGPLQRILPANHWDQDKERTYTAIAESAADCCVTVKLFARRFFRLRRANSRLFHSVLLVLFISLLYIGTTFNNLFISYTTVLVILLFPGFKVRSEYIEENLQKYGQIMVSYLWSYHKKMVCSEK